MRLISQQVADGHGRWLGLDGIGRSADKDSHEVSLTQNSTVRRLVTGLLGQLENCRIACRNSTAKPATLLLELLCGQSVKPGTVAANSATGYHPYTIK